MKRKKIPDGTKLPVVLTLKELDIIRNDILYDPAFNPLGTVQGKNIKIMLAVFYERIFREALHLSASKSSRTFCINGFSVGMSFFTVFQTILYFTPK